MPAIVSARAEQPIDIILAAIEAARAAGIRVRPGTYGVVCNSGHQRGRWELDDTDRNPGVSPLGAVLLHRQPPPMRTEDAAAVALDIHGSWVDGLADGVGLEPKDPQWMHSARKHMYLHGFETGVTVRISVTSRREGVA